MSTRSAISMCSQLAVGSVVVAAAFSTSLGDVIQVPVTIRDFTPDTHPDFERFAGDDRGMVSTVLGGDRKPVYAGPATGTPTTTGPAAFAQWFNDTPGVNLTTTKVLPFDNGMTTPGGIYSYADADFFPIDGELFGDYGSSGHNYHFTLEMHAVFTYQPGQTFNFSGDDDLWLFINDTLVIDLGGVHGSQSASLDLDSLGLTAGNDYGFDLFFAERHTTSSVFFVDTSIVIPAPGPLLVGGVAGLGLLRRRRS